MRKIIYPLLVILIVGGLFYGEKYVTSLNEKQEIAEAQTRYSEPSKFTEDFLPKSTTGEIVKHDYYILSYNKKHLQSEWVAYALHPSHLSDNSFKRPYFEIDNKVKGGSADWRNYQKSGYDRGHLCPAGDRRFSFEAYKETFLTSNASPQDRGFNSGIWNRLEIQIRNWVSKKGEMYIITGGVLKDGLPTIGSEKVSVPEYFYKIVVTYNQDKPVSIAFLIPNKATSNHISTFVTSVSDIENTTGLSFFTNLPQEIEAQLKMPIDYRFWEIRK